MTPLFGLIDALANFIISLYYFLDGAKLLNVSFSRVLFDNILLTEYISIYRVIEVNKNTILRCSQ